MGVEEVLKEASEKDKYVTIKTYSRSKITDCYQTNIRGFNEEDS